MYIKLKKIKNHVIVFIIWLLVDTFFSFYALGINLESIIFFICFLIAPISWILRNNDSNINDEVMIGVCVAVIYWFFQLLC